nr:N-glycosylase/DNA lyase [Pelodiscus sinensis]|eukprot:XP_014428761.2 N-glycosylase/DNA lyase [Pelodiscus sinensis]
MCSRTAPAAGGGQKCPVAPCPDWPLCVSWRESSPGHWTGVLAGRGCCYTVYEEEEEEEEGGSCKTPPQSELQPGGSKAPGSLYSEAPGLEPVGGADSCEAQQILRDYFQLDVDLAALYQAWGTVDPHFRQVAANFPGIRVLRQDPVECLFSFLCTSNNHLARITGMIERLCQAFGRRLCQLGTQPHHAFPSLQALAGADTEGRLRALGFGYRARFVSQIAQAVLEQFGAQGLHQLRSVPYPEARRLLCTLPGVGAKVSAGPAWPRPGLCRVLGPYLGGETGWGAVSQSQLG